MRLAAGSRLLAGARCPVVLVVLVALAGCAALRPAPLDVPAGHRVVMGRVDLERFGEAGVLVVILREDGAVRHELSVGLGGLDFAITLPPGLYRIVEVRTADDGRTLPTHTVFRPRLEFEIGADPAFYVGTLRIVTTLGRTEAIVADEAPETLRVLRARHPNIPEAVVHSLLRPF
jgi:hypothetical protein